jgi:hypothetical protein
VSKARQKGTQFENEIVALFNDNGFTARRIEQKGIYDEGDVKVTESKILFECKAQETMRLPEWIRKARKKNPDWVIFYKDDRRFADSVGSIAVMDADLFVGMMSFAKKFVSLTDEV